MNPELNAPCRISSENQMPSDESSRKNRSQKLPCHDLDAPWLGAEAFPRMPVWTEVELAKHAKMTIEHVRSCIRAGLPTLPTADGSVRISKAYFDEWSKWHAVNEITATQPLPITQHQSHALEFFRYPGGKAKLQGEIIKRLPSLDGMEYREPFFGSGRVGLKVLAEKKISGIWINDTDCGVASFWTAVIRYPGDLIGRIRMFSPTVEDFYTIRDELSCVKKMPGQRARIVDLGFKKLVAHQTSYSGLGAMSGPLGGRKQTSKYKVDSRWTPEVFCNKIRLIHGRFAGVRVYDKRCTDLDFADLITDTSRECVLYLDPPYFEKGPSLYQHSFTASDHERLAALLKSTKHAWVLSYDDCPEIRKMYDWATIATIEVKRTIKHSMNAVTGRKTAKAGTELLICP